LRIEILFANILITVQLKSVFELGNKRKETNCDVGNIATFHYKPFQLSRTKVLDATPVPSFLMHCALGCHALVSDSNHIQSRTLFHSHVTRFLLSCEISHIAKS